MSCQPCHIPNSQSMDTYTWKATGTRILFWDQLPHQVHFLEFGVGLADILLTSHCQNNHKVGRVEATHRPPEGGGGVGSEGEGRVR